MNKLIILLSISLIFTLFVLFQTSRNSDNRKYVVYECTNGRLCGGWADRLKGIMSAYAWSLITNRTLLVNIIRPCKLTEHLVPNQIEWYDEKRVQSYFWKKIWKIDNLEYRLRLSNFTLNDFNLDYKYISIKNNLDWLEPLSKNKNLHARLVQLGYEPNKFKLQYVFKDWYRKLFKLHPRLQTKYDEFLTKSNKTSNKLLCAQIRIGGRRENVAFDYKFTSIENTIVYWNYIKKYIFQNNSEFKLFLTTDTREVESEARKVFAEQNVMINEGLNAHLDRERHLNGQCAKVDKVFLDFHCLQLCDMAIISESGFGKLGVWNRDEPNKNLAIFSKQETIVIKKSIDELEIL